MSRIVVSVFVILLLGVTVILARSPTVLSQQNPSISIGSASAEVGGQATISLEANNIPSPGIGAWSIDVSYEPDSLRVVNCQTNHGVCNPQFGSNTVRSSGAVAAGLEGDNLLATITFECLSEDHQAALGLSIQLLVDANVGDPNPMDVSVSNQNIRCGQLQTATPSMTTMTPTITPTVTTSPPQVGNGLPDAGSGGIGSLGNSPNWTISGLALFAASAVVLTAVLVITRSSGSTRPLGDRYEALPFWLRMRPRG